jgi:hypothetical protein
VILTPVLYQNPSAIFVDELLCILAAAKVMLCFKLPNVLSTFFIFISSACFPFHPASLAFKAAAKK